MDDPSVREPRDAAARAGSGVFGGGASLAARLDAWLADARVERSADARAREHWLREAADADATFAGILLDLAERGAGIALATVGGRRHRGAVEVVGADFIAVRLGPAGEVLLALRAIASVRHADGGDGTGGERVVSTDLRLGDVLGELAKERARVRLVLLDGTDVVSGQLRATGQDVVTVRTDGEVPGTAHVRIGAIAEVAIS